MKRELLVTFAMCLIAWPVGAITTTGIICVDDEIKNECSIDDDDTADESPIDRDNTIISDENKVTHMVDWDGDTGTGEDVCRIGWTFNFDPLVMYEFYPLTCLKKPVQLER